ncbi:Rpp20 subunit of nuclear RNase MRP and P-domain-containing protein [Lasiosphaeris hirsuta]|uniref:Rpp20 subunit of nuclear RNase MRP and P-domain-containing protein n=1 Tax=Lasiosphaeris hirsuta TaxID=260670 RepID=A0AA40B1Q2_9PEZI|nr:Rpp20 subunit of nuclear RNase MRP and P-domain-containing protein [Lasiosphaeris hirsuta]
MEPGDPKPLVNRPEAKLPRLPKGSRIHKRSLPSLSHTRRQPAKGAATNSSSSSSSSSSAQLPGCDLDGYRMPPRAPHTVLIKVTSSAPFMSLVKRVRAGLDTGPQKTKGLPLTARIAALGVGGAAATIEEARGPITDAFDDVVLVATGRAIQKALEVGAFFIRNKELVVLFRTRSVAAIDDIVAEDEDADVEDQVRVRHVSCVEVGIRWAK